MFVISRFEQFIEYWWTGAQWTTKEAEAKRFANRAEAEAETSRFSYTCTITPVSVA